MAATSSISDSIDLPYGGPVSDAKELFYMSDARALVLGELMAAPESAGILFDLEMESMQRQRQNAAMYHSFHEGMLTLVTRRMKVMTPSPISGIVDNKSAPPSTAAARYLFAPVRVSLPPTMCPSGISNEAASRLPRGEAVTEGLFLSSREDPCPLLSSSSMMSVPLSTQGTSSTPPMTPTRSDVIHYEMLMGQQVNLSLWNQYSDLATEVQVLLRHVQRIHDASEVMSEKISLTNAARFVEQQSFKRQRDEVTVNTDRLQRKIIAMEKELGVRSTNFCRQMDDRAWLRRYLLD